MKTLVGGEDSILLCCLYFRSVQTIPSSFGSLASVYQQAQHSEAHSDQAMADISNKPRLYRPPPNSILIKVPQVSAVTNERAMLCDDCDSKFADRKSLVKHTRNQHQVHRNQTRNPCSRGDTDPFYPISFSDLPVPSVRREHHRLLQDGEPHQEESLQGAGILLQLRPQLLREKRFDQTPKLLHFL